MLLCRCENSNVFVGLVLFSIRASWERCCLQLCSTAWTTSSHSSKLSSVSPSAPCSSRSSTGRIPSPTRVTSWVAVCHLLGSRWRLCVALQWSVALSSRPYRTEERGIPLITLVRSLSFQTNSKKCKNPQGVMSSPSSRVQCPPNFNSCGMILKPWL